MIVLASASPRRRELLAASGCVFRVAPTGVDETLPPGVDHREAARGLALAKARAAASDVRAGERWILGADTLVALSPPGEGRHALPDDLGLAGRNGWRILGKPERPADARRMLGALSGSEHEVVTGVAVLAVGEDGAPAEHTAVEVTRVTMRAIEPGEVEAYVSSGEWRDKAGGYAIQETADAFVTGLAGGGFDNVVGLPVALALDLLRRCGAPVPRPVPKKGR